MKRKIITTSAIILTMAGAGFEASHNQHIAYATEETADNEADQIYGYQVTKKDKVTNATGLLTVNFTKDGKAWVSNGTATFIAPNALITAYHTLKTPGITKVEFRPDLNSTDVNTVKPYDLTNAKVVRLNDTAGQPLDVAIIVFDKELTNIDSDVTPAKLVDKDSNMTAKQVSLYGYYGALTSEEIGKLYGASGPIRTDSLTGNTGYLTYNIETHPGTSGAPIYLNNELVGVHVGSGTLTTGIPVNMAVGLTDSLLGQIKSVLSGSDVIQPDSFFTDKAGHTYYYDATGTRLRNTTKTINGKSYTFDANGYAKENTSVPTTSPSTGTSTSTKPSTSTSTSTTTKPNTNTSTSTSTSTTTKPSTSAPTSTAATSSSKPSSSGVSASDTTSKTEMKPDGTTNTTSETKITGTAYIAVNDDGTTKELSPVVKGDKPAPLKQFNGYAYMANKLISDGTYEYRYSAIAYKDFDDKIELPTVKAATTDKTIITRYYGEDGDDKGLLTNDIIGSEAAPKIDIDGYKFKTTTQIDGGDGITIIVHTYSKENTSEGTDNVNNDTTDGTQTDDSNSNGTSQDEPQVQSITPEPDSGDPDATNTGSTVDSSSSSANDTTYDSSFVQITGSNSKPASKPTTFASTGASIMTPIYALFGMITLGLLSLVNRKQK